MAHSTLQLQNHFHVKCGGGCAVFRNMATAAGLSVKCSRAPIILLLTGPLPNSLMQISQKRAFQVLFIREVHSFFEQKGPPRRDVRVL